MGNATAKAMELLLKGKPGVEAYDAAQKIIKESYRENKEWSLKGVITKTNTAIELARNADLGLKEIIGTEVPFPGARLDVLGRDHDGRLAIRDWKVKFKLESQFVEKERMKWRTSVQVAAHYPYMVAQHYGEEVGTTGVVLIVLSPEEDVLVEAWEVSAEHVKFMMQGVAQTWKRMEEIDKKERRPVPNLGSCLDYGRCPMYWACHTFYGDETKMDVLYEPRRWG